ncbi:shikimate O-hydroxycinnamoyltransferase [Marchantia polymorpha subsp. ruderalis]|uniref:Uncharacterized protein n=2 Tax=Marchantia polymorpha TaxID=3197 RepID=A0AAF6AV22_MARPO|nr:hypothetical protein MARPO_0002s0087 [Marchantia polymorpha]BBN00293.1 hypothetical protein Mp_1g27910 [Marchantia polymorpha subsp. ruderalis]|eukprot:PTQ49590.1 hypothetical protein MARPO_0002s0087 [Marchantia polymorpha]
MVGEAAMAKDCEQDLKLEMVGEPETILPAGPTPATALFLSNTDQVLVIPVETVYFYPANPAKPADKLVETLRDSLAKLLVTYHLMAGRLSMNEQEQRLEIDCNRKGAQFTHYTSGVSLEELGDVTLPNAAFRALVPTKFDATVVFDLPLLAIQVTTFKCGGYTVGVMMSHTLFDGPAAIEFFMNYAALARGEGLVCLPSLDRTPLKARDPPRVTFDHPELIKMSDLEQSNPFSTAESASAEVVSLEAPIKHVTKVFPFTPEMIEILKKKALEGDVIKRVSTFEVLAAHIWQSRTKAIELPEDKPTNLLFAVDIRKRTIPPLPKHYAGNAVFAASARDVPQVVRDMSFVEAVQRIQEAIARVTDEYIRSSIDWGQIYKGVPALAGGFFLSAWWKMPFYEIDYGWGKPIYAGPIVTPLIEFLLLLSNGTQDGGCNLIIALEPEQMAKFEEFVKVY